MLGNCTFASKVYVPKPRVCFKLEWTDFLGGEFNINTVFL